VDAGRAGSGTTGATFSWFNASSKIRLDYPREYFELNKTGVEHAYRLARELPDGSWLHPTGNIEVVSGRGMDQLRTDVAEMVGRGYPVSLVDAQAASDLEPALRLPADSMAACYPHEGWIDGPHLVRSLVDGLRRTGGDLVESDAVVRFAIQNGRVARAELASGSSVEADIFVLAAGIDTMALAALADVSIPMVERASPSVAGLLVHCQVPSDEAPPHRIVHVNGVAVRPNGDRRVLMVDAEGDPELTLDTPAELLALKADVVLRRAREGLPGLRVASRTSVVIGVRALPTDRVSIIGHAPGVDGLYVAATHSGISLAAIIAELAGSEIVLREQQRALEPFRPSRFVRSDPEVATAVQ